LLPKGLHYWVLPDVILNSRRVITVYFPVAFQD